MLKLTVRFLIASLILFLVSRTGLALWQWDRVSAVQDFWRIWLGGLRIDLAMLGMLAALPLFLSPWLGHSPRATRWTAIWFRVCWLLLAIMEAATPQFLAEYDTRPNRLFFIYLVYPEEVLSMLWTGYKLSVGGAIIGVAAMLWIGFKLFPLNALPDARRAWGWRPVLSVVFAALAFISIRGTLQHRPINPSTVAFANDAMVNALALNSFYSVTYAAYRMKDERSAESLYGDMAPEEAIAIVRTTADLPATPDNPAIPTLHRQQASLTVDKPRNLVLIVEESLGAQFVGSLGGQNLTPELDALAQEGWFFTRTYATGTRSVRGLEALTTGFPPTPAEAVVKMPNAQTGFFTLAELLGRQGYGSRFLYGGEAHFDNMRGFFLGNGFDEVVDLPRFSTKPEFVGSWGASDEDMFKELDHLLMQQRGKPEFILAFSVSNHSPWEYPEGRITPDGEPDTVENTVRYADWALGRFFETARTRPYWDDTVFLVVADHDARVYGATDIPVERFHIPALILGGSIAPRTDDRLISQIDLPPTLLSLIGISSEHPMIGSDLTVRSPGRAIMQFGDNYGYLRGDQLLVLRPNLDPQQYRWTPEGQEAVSTDSELAHIARGHVVWPSWAYRERSYHLPAR
ncbi:LTA synthase family protein [Kerstersia gyiorum]|uniref:LTA synthase family protein n=1 Tax=Kerstersia gyiorum TaxID=206506 RepID=UPI00209E3067|nr:LTA synthase family protein [Kerstersia gyiorum]MCP1632726.1 phosphoglycerol transferase MdoB-like AlkP superfamily enzyme [Kerstersia gyiorum]MCP1635744.1 phosphoglycerol transferase MdoB-like AlkP superfamily enzyme [Kerstersia gyiorum]MCP1670849.1 phosphoglycerol transferase MdoB-like AlkP superfamily enzyme [Kerstersia gyiorum]MCP1682294.1 phosphoglycerol transferase MdoB-like AlkP superfamily enzyme [Kerstersia gyiorum]MCP1708809.1 phosphoglycerol transferase MdoB-like AlkP superfamily